MSKEVRLAMLATIASIFLNWVSPATVFADEPISVGSRVQPPNLQLAKAQSQPEQLRSDPASVLGARLIQLPALGQASVKQFRLLKFANQGDLAGADALDIGIFHGLNGPLAIETNDNIYTL